MDDIIVDKRWRKIFVSLLNTQSKSADVRMRTAISWDPNISVVINILVLIILTRA